MWNGDMGALISRGVRRCRLLLALLVFPACATSAPAKPLDAYSSDGPRTNADSSSGDASDTTGPTVAAKQAETAQQEDDMLAKLLPADPPPPAVSPGWKLTVETSGGKTSEKRRTLIRADGVVEDDVASASRPREIRHGQIAPALVARLAAFVEKQQPQAPKSKAPAVSNASTVIVEVSDGKKKRKLVSKPSVDKDWAPARAIQNAVEIVVATTKMGR